jgi:hypothetical protein
MLDEKRRFTRVPFQVKAEITIDNVIYSSDKIINLSIGGCLLPLEMDAEKGTKCLLRILLDGTNSEISIKVKGEIFRCESGTVAIKFTAIGAESLFHLQNIVRYNYPDTDKIEQEIMKHPGLE